MTLIIKDKASFQEITRQLSEASYQRLASRIAYLAAYGDQNVTVELHVSKYAVRKDGNITYEPDPTGFGILWKRGDKVWMNGGLIAHGDDWGIHT